MLDFKTKINRAKTLADLAETLDNTFVEVSFLGTRKVKKEVISKKQPKTESVKLKLITKKAIELLRPFLKNWDYSLAERRNIKKIAYRINSFYETSDEILQKANVITKLFNKIQKFFALLFCVFYTTRGKWRQLSNSGLTYCYSKKQFRKAFPRNKLPLVVDETYKNINLYFKPDLINRPWHQRLLGYSS